MWLSEWRALLLVGGVEYGGGGRSRSEISSPPPRRPASSRVTARYDYSRITFSCVLYGATNRKTREQYASKIADNIPRLLQKYRGSRVVIYFNETTPRDFLERMRSLKPRENVTLVYFKERNPSHNIMYARFLAFDDPDATDWVFTIDPQEDLGESQNYDRLLKQALQTDGLQLAALWWPEKSSGARMFPGRRPSRVLDAGAIGVCKRYRLLKKVAPLVRHYMSTYRYGYGVDEMLLEEWVGSDYPKWFKEEGGVGFITTEGDPESDMELGDLDIVDPTEVGDDAPRLADRVVDFSGVSPGTEPHPNVAHYADKARFSSR